MLALCMAADQATPNVHRTRRWPCWQWCGMRCEGGRWRGRGGGQECAVRGAMGDGLGTLLLSDAVLAVDVVTWVRKYVVSDKESEVGSYGTVCLCLP